MKWLKNNNVELVLGISGSLFLINLFTDQDKDFYSLVIPFLVLGFILLYRRHWRNGGVQNSNDFFASYSDEMDEDELYEDAKDAVIDAGKASTSYIQRKLRVGYSRAARLMDMLEEKGVIGPADDVTPREVLKK